MDTFALDPSTTRDLGPEVLDATGRLKVMPAAYYAGTTAAERALLGHRHGLYSLPTTELCDWLRGHIGDRASIEIGAGNGVMAEHLGIVATDSYMQEDPAIRATFRAMGQPTITYGTNVKRLEARDAVRRFRPAVVIGAWITHRYDPRAHWRGGNQYGPDLAAIAERAELVLICNRSTHSKNPLLKEPHEEYEFPWLYSRSINESPNFIAVWTRR